MSERLSDEVMIAGIKQLHVFAIEHKKDITFPFIGDIRIGREGTVDEHTPKSMMALMNDDRDETAHRALLNEIRKYEPGVGFRQKLRDAITESEKCLNP